MKDYKSLSDDQLLEELGKLQDLMTIYYTDTNAVNDFSRLIKTIMNEMKLRNLEWKTTSF